MRMRTFDPSNTALIVVDMQKGALEREAAGEQRNNPGALANIACLLSAFRSNDMAIIHVRHASTEPNSLLRPELPGFVVIDEVAEQPGELVLVKNVNSSFIGTDLEERLHAGGIDTLMIVGFATNHCVETTARMAGNLGFDTRLVEDACFTFANMGPDGTRHSADAIHAMTLANLNGEFAEIVTTQNIVTALSAVAA